MTPETSRLKAARKALADARAAVSQDAPPAELTPSPEAASVAMPPSPAAVIPAPLAERDTTPLDEAGAQQFQAGVRVITDAVNGFMQGKAAVVDLAMICLLAEGHLLLEDVPGVGKTSLARSLASALGTPWQRIQFTPDLLPSDVTGVSVFHSDSNTFVFHPGPIFANVVLADEVNRASPRTQSALLEVMEERQVTVDGKPHPSPARSW